MLTSKPGDILRHKQTREPYLVIGKSAQGLYVVSLKDKIDPAVMQIILPRAHSNFEDDREMIDLNESEAKVIQDKLKVVESVQRTLK